MALIIPQEFKLKNGMEVILRNCEDADAEMFFKFHALISSQTQHTLFVENHPPDVHKLKKAWSSTNENLRDLRVAVFLKKEMIAMLGFQSEVHPWLIHSGHFGMMVLQDFWGQGIGQKLIEIMFHHAHSVGVERIEAKVRVGNDRGIGLYQKMGFQIEGTRRLAVKIDGEYRDEYFIAKIFQDFE